MRKIFRPWAVILPFVCWLFSAGKASAQFVVTDPPLEATSIAMKAEQALQYLKEVETAINTYNHLQLMVREVEQLATHPSTNIALDLATFSSVLAQSQAVALDLSQMDSTFNNLFAPGASNPLAPYVSQYNTWATSALSSIHAAANSAGYQGNMMQNEQQWMMTVNTLNQSNTGLDQGIQITNVVGLETVAQLQKLRMLVASDIAQQAVFSTTMLNAQQLQVNNEANLFTNLGTVADQRGW